MEEYIADLCNEISRTDLQGQVWIRERASHLYIYKDHPLILQHVVENFKIRLPTEVKTQAVEDSIDALIKKCEAVTELPII